MLKKAVTVLLALILVSACVVALPVSAEKHVVEEEVFVYDSPQSCKDYIADYVDPEEFAAYVSPFLSQCVTEIDLKEFDFSYSTDMVNAIGRYITYFIPDAFHYKTAVFSYTSATNKIVKMTVQYADFADEVSEYNECKAAFSAAADKLLNGLDKAQLTDVEKALLVHDRLAVWNEYDQKNYLAGTIPTVSYTAYGALVNRTSVCQGYALAYEYLLARLGIESEVCSSKVLNHAWNIVYINGKAYHVDVTWDDPVWDVTGRVLHTNFLRSAKGIASTGHKGSNGEVDYDTSATDTTYDNAYWQTSKAEFQLLDGKLYYVNNATGAIQRVEGATLTTVSDVWLANASQAYTSKYVYLSQYNGKLLYNTPTAVYKLDVDTKKSEKVYEPGKPAAYYYIYGFTYRNDKICCDISNTPSLTEEIKAKYSEETTCHFFDNACDTTCNLCGATRTTSHKYTNACDKTCNSCGATRTVPAHKYTNACDKTCNSCGATRTTSHSYEKKVTKATLTANGKIQNVCKVCGYTASTSTTVYRPTSFKLSATSYTYNGAVKTPTVTVKDAAGKTISSSNYTVTYATGRKNVGTYSVKITMKGNYSGTKTLTFKINPIDISKCSVKLSATSYTYNGAVKTPSVTVKNAGGTTLTKNTHYTVTYASGRKNAGTYKVTVKMKGNYGGSKTLSFKINPISISKCKLSLSATSYTYDGKTKTPSVVVKNASGTKLTKNTHYTVTYASGRKNVGTYKVTIKMKGNYSGTKTLTFKINPAKTTVSKVTPATKSLKVSITKKSTQVTGYQVQYSTSKTFKSVKTVNISSYKTTSTTIKFLKAKTTYYVRVRTYKTVSGTKYYSGWSTYKYAKTK